MPVSKDDRKPAVQLRVVNPQVATLKFSGHKSTMSDRHLPGDSWATVPSNKKAKIPSVKPAWGMTDLGQSIAPTTPIVNPWGTGETEIPDLREMRRDSDTIAAAAAAVQLPTGTDVTKATGPEQALPCVHALESDLVMIHPIVSQKKIKKNEREAKRKVKKQDVAVSPAALERPIDKDAVPVAVIDVNIHDSYVNETKVHSMRPNIASIDSSNTAIGNERTETLPSVRPNEQLGTFSGSITISNSQTVHLSNRNKHLHWLRFDRAFVVDRPTDVCLEGLVGRRCGDGNGTVCAFEANNVKDCPFHEPCEFLSYTYMFQIVANIYRLSKLQ